MAVPLRLVGSILALLQLGALILHAETSADFSYTTSDSAATITAYRGEGGAVTIPSTILGLPVTCISSRAFYNCTSLTSIAIPYSVVSIEAEAFALCSSLRGAAIPDRVTHLGDRCFRYCRDLASVSIGTGVTHIGLNVFESCSSLAQVNILGNVVCIDDMAFLDCQSLVSIAIPDSVVSIGDQAFGHCSHLLSLSMGQRITHIGDAAFYYCSRLQSLALGDHVTHIGNGAFVGCASLTEITLPDKVETISSYAFASCSSLNHIHIPDSVTLIGDMALYHCTHLTDITAGPNHPLFRSVDGVLFTKDQTQILAYPNGRSGGYTIPNRVTHIGPLAFAGCTSLTDIEIPASVTSIGSGAFSQCTRLANVALPDTVSQIAPLAFIDCASLTAVTLPSSVAHLDDYAFNRCTNLQHITFSNSLTPISDTAFLDCSNIQSIFFNGKAPNVANAIFDGSREAVIYYIAGTSGWGPTLAGRATATLIAPSIATQPSDLIRPRGNCATLGVSAAGNALTYQWKKDAANVTSTTGASLNFSSVETADAGTYRVTVSNQLGTVTSSAATLSVFEPIAIATQPANVTTQPDGTAIFGVVAMGPNLQYQWLKNGLILPGATSSMLLLSQVQPDAAGLYSVVISNENETLTSLAATLTVAIPPSITDQPQDATAAEGTSASFRVTASGNNLNYQWRRNGSNIVAATQPTLVIGAVKPADAGDYTVVIFNYSNDVIISIASSAARLTVSPDLRDNDGDGLTNSDETNIYGSDPNLADTDGDALTDGYEVGIGRYSIVGGSCTWAQASTDAQARGGILGCFPTEDRWNRAMQSLGEGALDTYLGVWIGASDAAKEGTWTWVSGEPFVFAQWATTRPSGATGNTLDYAEVAGGEGAEFMQWYDRSTSSTRDGYILEIDYPTNPLMADTDGDGVNDLLEIQAGTHPLIPDRPPILYPDADGDGASDAEEIEFGGNPQNAAVFPRWAASLLPPSATNAKFQVRFPTLRDHRYTIEASTDLVQWQPVGVTILGDGGTQTHDEARGAQTRRFFRVLRN